MSRRIDAMKRRLEVGHVLSKTFSAVRTDFVTYLGLATLLSCPMPLILYWVADAQRELQRQLEQGRFDETIDPFKNFGLWILTSVAVLFFQGMVTSAIVHGVVGRLRGRPANLSECLITGLRRMIPVLVVSAMIGVVAGFAMACCCLGLVLMTMWYVALPAVVHEKTGVFEALPRSAALTQGFRGPVFGVIVVIYLLGNMPLGTVALMVEVAGFSLVAVVVQWAAFLVYSVLNAVGSAVTYHELRSIKEGVDVDDVAAVFD